MLRPLSLAFLAASFFTGLGFSFMFPMMSLYLIDDIGSSPIQMGVYLAIQVLSGVVVSQYLGKQSDKGWSRKRIIYVSQLCFMAAMLVFINTRSYAVALMASIFLLSIGAATLPQMFTIGRLYADKELGEQSNLFVSLLRAAIAVAWVAGPPAAFYLKASFGLSAAFGAAIVSAALMLLITRTLPDYKIEPRSDEDAATVHIKWFRSPAIVFYLISCVFMLSASTMYNSTIPLYVTKELLLDAQWAGYLMGLAAFLEIPFMLLAGMFGPRFGYKRSIAFGLLAGAVFYVVILSFTSLPVLLISQILNGIFIAIISTLGMIYIQNIMRHEMGLATTLYTNTYQLAALIGSLMVGGIAQWFSYYSVFIGCLVLVLLSLVFLGLVHQQRNTVSLQEVSNV